MFILLSIFANVSLGRIEFVRDTKLERLYFPIPAFCRGTDENLLQVLPPSYYLIIFVYRFYYIYK